ncbi:MAG: hypothetical protein HC833_05865 [Leptolyngbyaceae cyanobacterium RM1_406_9]|nr:hypothetical protein [Leptolyngbyaceae cyanobacterium RM1_406_9]
MVIVVVTLNCLIALCCLYAAWRIWRLRRFLAKVTATLTTAERNTHAVLYGAPKGIGSGQTGIYQSRRSYQQLQLQLQQLQQILGWVRVGATDMAEAIAPFLNAAIALSTALSRGLGARG